MLEGSAKCAVPSARPSFCDALAVMLPDTSATASAPCSSASRPDSSASNSASRSIFDSCVFSSVSPCARFAFSSSICRKALCNFFFRFSISPIASPPPPS
eukprot:scaffold66739_cov32-Tisochrysis_lutea.AAC.1